MARTTLQSWQLIVHRPLPYPSDDPALYTSLDTPPLLHEPAPGRSLSPLEHLQVSMLHDKQVQYFRPCQPHLRRARMSENAFDQSGAFGLHLFALLQKRVSSSGFSFGLGLSPLGFSFR